MNIKPSQKQENKTALPDKLKSGVENLSGISMDDVKVHHNSATPAQLSAHAYAQGTDIHIKPGNEKHLSHEAWHVVQEKQGIVKPTKQLEGVIPINDNNGLEKEADIMGKEAIQEKPTTTHFAPELHIPKGTFTADFYTKFGATENFCFRNDDGSIHVAELEINGAIFHLHEIINNALEPVTAKGVTAVIGLFVSNVDEVMQKAIDAGATEINPAQDHDYGYRQGMFKDPFGHHWQIQKKIS